VRSRVLGAVGRVVQAGGVLSTETVRKAGLDTAIWAAPAPWRKDRAVHDPGKILLDVALGVAMGGDCLADMALPRAEPRVFGPVAYDPTVSRLIDTLAKAGPKALAAIRTTRAEVRRQVGELAGADSAASDGSVTFAVSWSSRIPTSRTPRPTWKKSFSHHPLVALADHGPAGGRRAGGRAVQGGQRGAYVPTDVFWHSLTL
jgi:hypothetical protein